MPFVKVLKNKQYFKRYQVKFRRRREGKTDYRARKRLTAQDKNKYNAPKYRLVVRITNRYVLTQIAYATIEGDKIICQATSSELERYGLKVGLKNYAAAYCTGLLIARRLLKQLGLDEAYTGNEEPDGEINTTKDEESGRTFYVPELDDERRPFRAILDVGIRTTSTGNRVFGVLKGASDGGLDIPHNSKRFPGASGKSYSAEDHKDRIFGQHVAEYMTLLADEDQELFNKHFAKFVAEGLSGDDMEDLYTKVHEAIREDPSPAPKKAFKPDKSYKKKTKDSKEERDARAAAKKAAILAAKE